MFFKFYNPKLSMSEANSEIIKNEDRFRLDQRIPNFQFNICHFSFLIFFSVATALLICALPSKNIQKNGPFRSLEA